MRTRGLPKGTRFEPVLPRWDIESNWPCLIFPSWEQPIPGPTRDDAMMFTFDGTGFMARVYYYRWTIAVSPNTPRWHHCMDLLQDWEHAVTPRRYTRPLKCWPSYV